MLLPSEALWTKLSSNASMLDYENMDDGTIVLVAKLPAFLIKAIYNGAPLSFILSGLVVQETSIICVALRVYDDPNKPLTLFHVLRSQKDFNAFNKALNYSGNSLHLFDELCRPSLELGITVATDQTCGLFQQIMALNPCLDDISKEVEEMALDLFQENLELVWNEKSPKAMVWEEIGLDVISRGTPSTVYMVNSGQHIGGYQIADSDEGGGLEQTAHQLLDYVYGEKSFRSPVLIATTNQRELIDILAIDSSHLTLVEAKALSMLGKTSSTEANSKSITRDIKKGIRQINGAVREICSGAEIVSAFGEKIEIESTEIINGIVLVSHMHPNVDWKWVAVEIKQMAQKKGILFHVMDAMELFRIASVSKENPAGFFVNLFRRWELVLKVGNAFIESRLGPE